MVYKIAVFPGDGIGREVTDIALKLLETIGKKYKMKFLINEGLIGGAAIDKVGIPLPNDSLKIAKKSNATLLGAVGGSKWDGLDYFIRPERALLGLRKELKLFANLRPVKLFDELINASTLKREVIEGVDIIVIRELTGGIYFGKPKGIKKMSNGTEKGINTEIYTTKEIERIAELSFQIASKRRKNVISVDKANVLESSELWRRVVSDIHKKYTDVELTHMYVDNCAMQLVRNPKQFDVILTTNLFGDILSDEAAMLTGSIGMLPSASIGGKTSLYEPVHGSAPDIAGQDKANPIAAILSVAMMMRYSFQNNEASESIEMAIEKVLKDGYRTADIYHQGMKLVGTKEMGTLIIENIN